MVHAAPPRPRRSALRTALIATSAAAAVALAHPPNVGASARASSAPAGISADGQSFDGQAFDYVIVGGGNAGLVVASRLSEQTNLTVAVIEAGSSGEGQPSITTPDANLYNSSVGTDMDWAYTTTPQSGLLNRQLPWARGKTLGGSSAINGLYLVRQPEAEQDSWANLLAGTNGSEIWNWSNVLDAMKRTETYTPVAQAAEKIMAAGDPSQKGSLVPYNASHHGKSGPIHHSYPGYTYEDVGAFLGAAAKATNMQINNDAYGGNNSGPFLSISSINPSNWTRSFARTGYLDPYQNRSNLHVLTGFQTTKIVFDDSTPPKATGVEISAAAGQPTYTVKATGEVILSAGVIGSPQLLQLSGVGDSSVLDPLKIKQVANVPGVGFNLQDHLSSSVKFSPVSNTTIAPAKVTGNATMDSYVNSATAYVPLSRVLGSNTTKFISSYRSNIASYVKAYDAPDTVKAGFNATSYELADHMYPQDVPAVEILLGNTYGNILVECGLQHPASRGSVKINSTSAFDKPQVDPGYLLHEEDATIMREGCRLARQVGTTAPLSNYAGSEIAPGTTVQSDADWNTYVSNSSGTEYHPSSSCSMLPLDLGGVVDSEFNVYNTQNLRVIDSSVPPLSMSQHLMTITYGLGEIGADLIKAKANGQAYTAVGANSSTSTTASGSKPAASSSNHQKSGAATSYPAASAVGLAVASIVAAATLF